MRTLNTIPEELLSIVLQNCSSFPELRALILTSKTLYTVWRNNHRTILWHVGQSAIPGFSDALIAARATNIAKASILCGELPPHQFPTATLSGDDTKPTLSEIKQVQSFACLANYLETRARSAKDKRRDFLPHRWYFDSLAWSQQTWDVWREGYHRSVYRYLTAGAVLCRAYYEPLVCEKRPKGILFSLLSILEGKVLRSANSGDSFPGWFSDEEKKYISRIPLYDSQRYEAWEEAFKPFEELFVQESRKHSLPPAPDPEWRSAPHSPEAESSGRSLYRTFGAQSKNLHALDDTHLQSLFTNLLHFLYLVDGDIRYFISLPGDTPTESPDDPVTHSVPGIFLFGSFTLMDINIRQKADGSCVAHASTVLSKLTSGTLLSTPNPMSRVYLGFPNMHNYLKKVWDVSGVPNCYDWNPVRKTPPPVSFFVEYMLRKYFGLRFSSKMFDATIEVRCAWCAFHQFGGVFTGLTPGQGKYVGRDLLESVEQELSVAVFDEYAWYY
ncbi:hypothetical protein BDW75DRAFT_34057 [Aspergillus navahoensis]